MEMTLRQIAEFKSIKIGFPSGSMTRKLAGPFIRLIKSSRNS
jgi:hypothetical protein